MKVTTGAFVLTLALGCATAIPSMAQPSDHRGDQPQAQQPDQRDRDQQRPDQDRAQEQDRDHRADQDRDQHADQDRDQHADQDRDHRNMSDNDSAYYSNKYYQQGWKDGLKHKRKNHKWKNDEDRRAYEAGFAHGDRGEKWHKPNVHDRH
ncbi:MAG: hypothetical protein ACRD4F_18955 [Candidatus Angelobacter sp.]